MSKQADSSLASKIDRLFAIVLDRDRKPYTHEAVASACREATGESFSGTYLWQLRTGNRDNPTKRHLEALAEFFGVPPAYFFDDEASRKIRDELELLGALRDKAVRQVALRAVTLSPQGLNTITEMIEVIGRQEDTDASGDGRVRKQQRAT